MAESHEVHITIDKKKYTSPTPTTGHALYVLGQVAAGYDLFRENHGSGDDELIPNSDARLELHNDERFYTAQSTLNPGNEW
jgi:hypothetical protein